MSQVGSILDKIIASKEDQEKQAFNPEDVINQLLARLTSKEADVLQRRFGLSGKPQETLEAIGSSYNVTRERVRQIENLAVKKIKDDPSFTSMIKPVEHVVMTVLEEYGGVMSEEHLLNELFAGDRSASNDQAMIFMLGELIPLRFDSLGPNKHFVQSWKSKTTDLDFVHNTIGMLQDIIRDHGTPLDLVVLVEQSHEHSFYKVHAERLNEKVILAYLEASKQIDRNPFEEYGLAEWGSVVPRRMNDKIYLVLKKIGKPMHFVDIAKQITEVFKKEAYPPTVHNELILNKHYVLVGRGIYALQEWGYKQGVVADVIADILAKQPQPLTREQIVDSVMDQRVVKRNTIHLALTDKDRFRRLPDGRYTINPTK